MMKWFFGFLFIFGTLSLPGGESPDGDWKSALKYFQDAETKVRKGANGEAVVLLKTCVKKLKELRYDHPDWNSSVVRNRINATEKRIDAVEQLILTSISSLSREQLITRLKETQISKAKFSKAMMIIYEDLKDTKQRLSVKEKDLEEARYAASNKIISNSKMDKLTFENLKLKKSLQERDASIAHLQKSLKSIRKGNGTDAIAQNLEEQYTTLQKRERVLLQEKAGFMKEKQKILGQLKDLSFKYTDLLEKEKKFGAVMAEKDKVSQLLRDALKKEIDRRKSAEIAAEKANSNFKLAKKRISEFETNEKSLMKSIESIKADSVSNDTLMKHKKKNGELARENNRLRQVAIDLTAKNKKAAAEAEKNKAILAQYLNDPDRVVKSKLQEEVNKLMKEILSKNRDLEKNRSSMISLSSEMASLKAQLKLQKNIISDLKKKEPVKMAGSKELSLAYNKNEADLQDRLKFAQDKIARLEKVNRALKEENISGDEQMIRKYIKVRDELKMYKTKLKIVAKETGSTNSGGILEAVMSEEERKEQDRKQKIQEYLFQAQKAEKSDNVQSAIGLYSQVLKQDRNNYDALLRLGFLHFNRRHFHDARVHLKKAWYLEPDDPDLLLALGISELELDNLDMAVSSLSRLVGMHPKNSNARVQLGVSLHGIGWTEAALSQLKKACELDDKNAEAAFNLAIVCLALNEPKIKEAKKHYEKAVKLGIVRDPELERFFKQQK